MVLLHGVSHSSTPKLPGLEMCHYSPRCEGCDRLNRMKGHYSQETHSHIGLNNRCHMSVSADTPWQLHLTVSCRSIQVTWSSSLWWPCSTANDDAHLTCTSNQCHPWWRHVTCLCLHHSHPQIHAIAFRFYPWLSASIMSWLLANLTPVSDHQPQPNILFVTLSPLEAFT